MRPGVNVTSRASAPARGAPTSTGVAFFAGLAAKGPTDQATLVRNMGDFVDVYGGRVAYGTLYDACDVAFQEGATEIYVVRVVGPAAVLDTVTLNDAQGVPAASLIVSSIGEYDSDLRVAVVAGDGAGQFRLEISNADGLLERSPNLDDTAAAAAWGQTSEWVRVTVAGAQDPAVVAATPLAGGNDDRAAITDTERGAALALFTSGLGPGQVAYPGGTTEAIHTALLQHAELTNRTALLDAADTNSVATLDAAADAQRAADVDPAFGGLFAAWYKVPGVVRNTLRTVPPSAVVAGMIARSDAGGNANIAAAGANGESRYAVDVSQTFTDAERETLNNTGVNVSRVVHGSVRLYGFRSLVDADATPEWLSLANHRLRMQITAQASEIGEQFMFSQIDGRGVKIAEFGGSLTGMLQRHYLSGALYGEQPSEAFAVNVGPTVNTPATIADGQLRAVLSLRMSPFAEMTVIEIVKVGITENV